MFDKPSFSDPHNENKKLEIRPNPKESFGRKTPTTTPRPPAPPTRRIKKDNEYYEELIKSSNRYHNDVYEYIDENGADEEFQAYLQGEYHWLKSVATRNRFKLDE